MLVNANKTCYLLMFDPDFRNIVVPVRGHHKDQL